MSDKTDPPAANEPTGSEDPAAIGGTVENEPPVAEAPPGDTPAVKADGPQPAGEGPFDWKTFGQKWRWVIAAAAVFTLLLCMIVLPFGLSSIKKALSITPTTTTSPTAAGISTDPLRVPAGTEVMPLPLKGDGIALARYFAWASGQNAKSLWAEWLQAADIKIADVRIVSLSAKGPDFRTPCKPSQNIASGHPVVFYCHEDHTVYLPGNIILQLWPSQPDGPNPAFAAAGLAVQAYNYAVIEALWEDDRLPEWSRKDDALLATCLTGVWVNAVYSQTSPTDAAGTVAAILRYDSRVAAFAPAGSERTLLVNNAYWRGFWDRSPSACLNLYWDWGTPKPMPSASPFDDGHSTLRPTVELSPIR